jgi:hypothetical protein
MMKRCEVEVFPVLNDPARRRPPDENGRPLNSHYFSLFSSLFFSTSTGQIFRARPWRAAVPHLTTARARAKHRKGI